MGRRILSLLLALTAGVGLRLRPNPVPGGGPRGGSPEAQNSAL
ncbi:MAG: hypothetical protein ACLR6W_02705 [Evtepia sp.]